MAVALALSLVVASGTICKEDVGDNETCVLRDNLAAVPPSDGVYSFDGAIVVPAGQHQRFSGPVAFRSSSLVLEPGSAMVGNSRLKFLAASVRLTQASLRAKDLVFAHSTCESMSFLQSELEASRKVSVTCVGGNVSLFDANFTARWRKDALSLKVLSETFFAKGHTRLMARSIQVVTWENLVLAAEVQQMSVLDLSSYGPMSLGWQGGFWTVRSMWVRGMRVDLARDHRVEALGQASCSPVVTEVHDLCENTGRPVQALLRHLQPDLFFVTQALVIGARARLLGSAVVLCCNNTLLMRKSASINSDGRGCPPGQGIGAGETRSLGNVCGGAGASNLGTGGFGAHLHHTLQLEACARPGAKTPYARPKLPLGGASGGGCGVPQAECLEAVAKVGLPHSSGGGLVWLSAGLLKLNSQVRVSASGTDGGLVAYKGTLLASGGGAGGQIVAHLGACRVVGCQGACEKPAFVATGGRAMCSSRSWAVGGAGGGGFIGLSVETSLGHDSAVLLDVTGGDLTSTCADTLPQSSLNVILGLPGVATSLSPCAAGHAGPFCAACAAGLWGDGQLCRPCATLQGLGFYVARGWPNASCPYQCKRGLPHVKLNPECLSNLRFAISCLGGRLGLVASLLCPVLIFLGARFCRAPPAIQSTSFPSELLPKHSRRIFLPGENSFERPWRVEVLATECSEVVLSRLSEILAVPAWEPVCLFAAWLLCPPLFQLAAYQLRRRRAQKAQALLPGPPASGASASRLGCDGGATLGFLDIFDMERSLVDWAPSLRQEHIFLVRGQGTWSCPWELDVGDPLLLGVAPSQLAPQAAFSLVCAFNRLSQHLARPLTDSDPALRQLQELRRQHLAQVQVFRLRSREVCSSGPTFSDLVRRIPSSTQDAEFRLGLVFSATANPANRFAEREAPLVTPQRPELPEPGPEVATKEETSGDWRRKLASFRFWLLVRCSCPQASFLTMSLVFLILVVFDVMACALMAYSLWALAAPGVLRRWLLLPTPLAPLLAPALGLAALLEGRTPLAQYLHRGHAQLALRSLLNLVPVALVLKAELLLPFCVVLVLNLCTIYAAAAFSVLAAEAADRCAAKAHSAHSAERRAASTQMMVLPPRSQTVSDADPGGFQGVP